MGAAPQAKFCNRPDDVIIRGCGACRPDGYLNTENTNGRDVTVPLSFLGMVPLFRELTLEQQAFLLEMSEAEEQPEGHVFMKRGEISKVLHVIVEGQVLLCSNGRILESLQSGDYFGEMGLTYSEPCDETIIAEMPTSVLKIASRHFHEMGLVDKLFFTRRRDPEKSLGPMPMARQKPKTAEDHKVISEGFRSNKHLSSLTQWDDKRVAAIAEQIYEEEMPAGKELVLGRDDPGYCFYIVKTGSFEILIDASLGGVDIGRDAEHVGMVSQGGIFGEVALMCPVPRAITLAWTALETSTVWVVDIQHINTLLAKIAVEREKENLRHIQNLTFLAALQPSDKLLLSRAMVRTSFMKGDNIYEMADASESFFILFSGVVVAVKFSMVVKHMSASPESPVILGEMALLNDEPRAETIEVISDIAKTLTMDKVSFETLLGPSALAAWKARERGTLQLPQAIRSQ